MRARTFKERTLTMYILILEYNLLEFPTCTCYQHGLCTHYVWSNLANFDPFKIHSLMLYFKLGDYIRMGSGRQIKSLDRHISFNVLVEESIWAKI